MVNRLAGGRHASLRVATRGSALARAQADAVATWLGTTADVRVEPVVVETAGDRRLDAQIWELGARGVFVKEVEAAVLDGRADFAVHSAKDLPSSDEVPELVIAAFPRRGDPRDALVGSTLEGLPVGGLVGTGSVRRRSQLAWHRPDLTFGGLRGNIDSRLEKLAGFDAIVVAAAALRRLGRVPDRCEVLEPTTMVPQVGQGALAVQCRADDDATRQLLAGIDDRATRSAVETERAWLREIGGGCDRPVGAHATIDGHGRISLVAVLATGDGRIVLRHSDSGSDPTELGRRSARFLLDRAGGATLIEELAPA